MSDMGVNVDTSAADKMWRYPPASGSKPLI